MKKNDFGYNFPCDGPRQAEFVIFQLGAQENTYGTHFVFNIFICFILNH
jgi:hypothetical protein